MATRYPKHRARNAHVAGVDLINKAIAPFAEECSGNLNEHNWQKDLTQASYHTAGYSLRIKKLSQVVDHSTMAAGEPDPDPTDYYKVPTDTSWHDIDDLSHSFSARGGPVKVISGLQVNFGEATTTTGYYTLLAGAQFGIAIDGAIQGETVIGGSERDIDARGEGLKNGRVKLRVSGVFQLTAGYHTISIQARTVRGLQFIPLDEALYVAVFNRMALIIEGH